MATLGTQSISTSYNQVLKTFGSNIVDGTLRAVSSGDEAGVSALQISTTGVKSTGTFAVDGASTFGSHVTMSTGTATIGTESVGLSTIGTLSVTNTATLGSAKIGAAGPTITKFSFGTALFPLTVVGPYNSSGTSTGTFAVTGAQLGDYCAGSINSIGSATGAAGFYAVPTFYVISADTVKYAISGPASQGTIGTGVVGATAWRVTA